MVDDKADGKTSLLFTQVKDHGRRAYGAYMAIYRNHGDHVLLAAPSMQALERMWEPIAGLPLDKERVQRVLIVAAPKK